MKRKVGFDGDSAAFLAFLRSDPRFYATSPEELLKEASYIAKRPDAKLPSLFGLLPRLPYGVAPVPDAIAPKYTSGRYVGAPVGGTPARLVLGQHVRPSTSGRSTPSADLPRRGPGGTISRVRWRRSWKGRWSSGASSTSTRSARAGGLYSEWLGIEAGFYTDPVPRLRPARLRGVARLPAGRRHRHPRLRMEPRARHRLPRSNTTLLLYECETEVDRYISWFGQALVLHRLHEAPRAADAGGEGARRGVRRPRSSTTPCSPTARSRCRRSNGRSTGSSRRSVPRKRRMPPATEPIDTESLVVDYRLTISARETPVRRRWRSPVQTVEIPVVADPAVEGRMIGRVVRVRKLTARHAEASIAYPWQRAGLRSPAAPQPALRQHLDAARDPPRGRPLAGGAPRSVSSSLRRRGLRDRLGVADRPLLATSLKPVGLSPAELGRLAAECVLAGSTSSRTITRSPISRRRRSANGLRRSPERCARRTALRAGDRSTCRTSPGELTAWRSGSRT
ncbi:MAG: DUF885 family protein [Thermoanaerobaculia bacterium]